MELDTEHPLAHLLFETTGPETIPFDDERWNSLINDNYDLLVHLDPHSNTLIETACQAMARHAVSSSNLAALSLHTSKLLIDMHNFMMNHYYTNEKVEIYDYDHNSGNMSNNSQSVNVTSTSPASNLDIKHLQSEFARKLRMICGTLNLLRILTHATIESCCSQSISISNTNNVQQQQNRDQFSPSLSLSVSASTAGIREAFMYREHTIKPSSNSSNCSQVDDQNVDAMFHQPNNIQNTDTAVKLLDALILYLSLTASSNQHQKEENLNLLRLPIEFYDSIVFVLQLFLVLLSTQLYQPMISSAQIQQKIQNRNPSSDFSETKKVKSHKKNPPRTKSKTAPSISTRLKNVEDSGCNFFLDKMMSEAYKQNHNYSHRKRLNSSFQNNGDVQRNTYYDTPNNNIQQQQYPNWSHSLISSILNWIVKRPKPPPGTISSHYCAVIKSIVDARGDKIGVDGMYENHLIVHATRSYATTKKGHVDDTNVFQSSTNSNIQSNTSNNNHYYTTSSLSSKGGISRVLNASSALLLIPFRLVKLAMSTIGLIGNGQYAIHDAHKLKMNQNITSNNDAIWLSDSPVSDLGCTLFLLLQNNYRSNTGDKLLPNPFTMELSSLCDNRWESRRDSFSDGNDYMVGNDDFGYSGPHFHQNDVNEEATTLSASSSPTIAINFESLFETFGSILHNEMGALLLYTILQSSPTFYASVAARSDLDTLIMPLIRTLYFSSILVPLPQQTTSSAPAAEFDATSTGQQHSNKMYRSQSQLYVVLILLLLFSQDLSFGPDAFRRVVINSVPWYKERNLKDISLGSIMILTILRSITYNLNRSNDGFLISNCCAVLLNLAPHIVNIHTYTAMRLASVTLYCCKRYSVLLSRYQGKNRDADVASILKLYGEVRFFHII